MYETSFNICIHSYFWYNYIVIKKPSWQRIVVYVRIFRWNLSNKIPGALRYRRCQRNPSCQCSCVFKSVVIIFSMYARYVRMKLVWLIMKLCLMCTGIIRSNSKYKFKIGILLGLLFFLSDNVKVFSDNGWHCVKSY